MTISGIHRESLPLETAKTALAQIVEDCLSNSESAPPSQTRILRVEIPVGNLDLIGWLNAQTLFPKMYWKDRDKTFATAGLGIADAVEGSDPASWLAAYAHIRTCLTAAHPGVRYYGGMRFQPCRPASPEWALFHAFQFVLPRFELFQTGSATYLACNLFVAPDVSRPRLLDTVLGELDELTPANDAAFSPIPGTIERQDVPNLSGWCTMVERGLEMIREGPLEKVVLARETAFRFAKPADPLALLHSLANRAGRTYLFGVLPADACGFIGASPERLYSRHDVLVRTEALAGTRPRGATPQEDLILGRELLSSDKDLREHGFVLAAVRDALNGLCRKVDLPPAVSLLKLPRCQHLLVAAEGMLRTSTEDTDLLEALHPTPAVGGYPTELALDAINQIESFDRGWYAGPVGWLGRDGAEFAVAIRSGLVSGEELRLYSGAGIVRGSDPLAEWSEINNKLSEFLGVLNGHD